LHHAILSKKGLFVTIFYGDNKTIDLIMPTVQNAYLLVNTLNDIRDAYNVAKTFTSPEEILLYQYWPLIQKVII